jgi:putative redox protein
MRAVARRTGSRRHEIAIDSGHVVVSDEPPDKGGDDEGPTPLELLSASLAGCVAVTMELYADRKGWELGELEVTVDADRPDPPAKPHFDVAIHIPAQLEPAQLERLLKIAARCPVHLALEGGATFSQREA